MRDAEKTREKKRGGEMNDPEVKEKKYDDELEESERGMMSMKGEGKAK